MLPEAAFVSPSGKSKHGSHQVCSVDVCEQLWWLRYDQGRYALKDKDFRLRGTLVHLAMAYYRASQMKLPPPFFLQKDLLSALEEKGAGLPHGIRCAKEMLSWYQEEYPLSADPWEPMFIEEEFEAPIKEIDPNPIVEADLTIGEEFVSCRPDVIVKVRGMHGPELWVVDYKTQTSPTKWGKKEGLERWNPEGEYALNWQVIFNLLVLRAACNRARLGNLPIAGFVIQRLTREPDPKTGAYYFDRHVLSVSPKAYEQSRHEIRASVSHEHEVRAKVARGVPPRKSFWACWGRYGACDYRDVCKARDQETASQILNERFGIEPRV